MLKLSEFFNSALLGEILPENLIPEIYQTYMTIALAILMFIGLLKEIYSPEITVGAVIAAFLALGILDMDDVLSAFTNKAPITIACMFIISAALERTGVIDTLGRFATDLASKNIILALTALFFFVMVASAFMNNTPIVVVMTPIIIALSKKIKIFPSKLLMPLSFFAILGGTCTLIGTSTNILVDGIATTQNLKPFTMFEITKAGLVLAVAGTTYIILIGKRFLPEHNIITNYFEEDEKRMFLAEAIVSENSNLIGKLISETIFAKKNNDYKIVDIVRNEQSIKSQKKPLEEGDTIIFKSSVGEIVGIKDSDLVSFEEEFGKNSTKVVDKEIVIAEGIIGPDSNFNNRKIKNLNLPKGVYIRAIHRRDANLKENLDNVKLKFGDAVILEGEPKKLKRLFTRHDLMDLDEPEERPVYRDKEMIALLMIGMVIAFSSLKIMPIATVAVLAATIIILTNCIDPDEIYQAINWPLLMLIYGMLAFSIALEKTGIITNIADFLSNQNGAISPFILLSMIYLFTSILTELISNNAACVIITPIAINLAINYGVDPRPFVVAVMFGASASFATPFGYQTNTFVYNAGGYKFVDFLKIGIPLNIFMWLVASFTIPYFWPL